MNLSMNWLADFVSVKDIAIRDFCERMTYTGSKVEGYEVLGDDIQHVVVARVVKMERHPDSDHLFICQVDTGAGVTQIVTGAQNLFEGAIVPAALPVAHLPGDVTIKAGKLRGVESNGMLCSFGELNLTAHDCPGKEANGILILDESFADKIGQDIREAMDLSDTVVEFEITSNRPDCLSVIGLAREAAITFGRPLTLHAPAVKGAGDGDSVNNYLTVGIEAPDLCYRYAARVVKNVKIQPSPQWLRRRLRAAGVRPINNIVDITNYVMLEYGQPMHAFDYTMLDGASIRVRRATDGEVFKSLDDVDHVLDSSMLVIADERKACALAGVMGGANSEITENTATVVFESACFKGTSVRVTAKRNKMRTESSARFEKELDPENCMPALQRACELVELLGAGDVVDGVIDCWPTHKPQVQIPLEVERINRFLGVNLTEAYMTDVLRKLDCRVEDGIIIPPSFRGDLLCMNDIAEEIIRMYGYNNIPATHMNAETTQGGRTPKQAFEVSVERALYGMGLDQIQTFSFVSPKYYDRIGMPADSPLRKSVVISNPLGEDTSVMRTTALPSMLEVLARNNNFSNENVALFENATVYLPSEDVEQLPTEKKVLTLGMYGNTDFYALKGIVENLLTLAGIKEPVYTACTEEDQGSFSYHPGRCAKVLTGTGRELGIFGQIHPTVAAVYGFNMPVFAGAIQLDALWEAADLTISYQPLPKFPATTRDFAFVCPEDMEIGTVEAAMRKSCGKLVESIALFDVYRGDRVGEGRKSVAFRVTLRAADRTLTVEEADKLSKKLVKDLEYKLGLTLRS